MEKIIQIIPCENWWVEYDYEGKTCYNPIVCIALYDTGDISYLDVDTTGIFSDPAESANFVQILYSRQDLSRI
jgi:hypothetical protein